MTRCPQCFRVESDETLKFCRVAYVELGEKDKAFAALEDVYNSHSNFVGYFKIDPQLSPLRDDPRFPALLRKAGFPP